ncbi:PREDICTED: transcription termination factor MTERF8, chloroplastic [Tarenaya hassleriana]|uniref:transcription termination factor MTERF8, chloroplastic n=1 Tax=Tarenaya hassleriana TaxID=28532 RepID=UPI00053C6CB6|nr:PREDICTED: transcription termination factor MTERF8, chloroplastic [Tarenaya hassleriana]
MLMLTLPYCSVSSFPPPTRFRCQILSSTPICCHGIFSASPFRTELRPFLVRSFGHRETALLVQFRCFNSRTDAGSQIGLVFSFFQEFGLTEEETELLLAKNPEINLTPLEKIRGRVLSFQSLKINGLKLQLLISKYPKLLTSEEIDPIIRFLVDELEAKLEPALVERLFSVADPSVLVGCNQKVRLLIRHGIPKDKISHVLEKVNLTKLLCHRSVEDIERMISFFEPFGGIGIIVRRPSILNFDLDGQLVPKVSFLRNLSGEDDYATGTVLRRLPAILSYNVEHMVSHVEFLKSFAGLTNDQVFKIIHMFPNVISTSKERKLRPRIEFLKQCGLDSLEIFKFLSKAPLFLALSEDNLSHKLGFLAKIGYEHRTKELARAMGAVTRTSSDNMQKVIGLYLSYGLSLEDILAMSKKHPPILQYTHSSLEEKMEYLIGDMGREVEELLVFPAFLGYKLDGRIKRRYEAKRMTRGENMSLNTLLTVSTERFLQEEGRDCIPHSGLAD